jgi:hypothetical protein
MTNGDVERQRRRRLAERGAVDYRAENEQQRPGRAERPAAPIPHEGLRVSRESSTGGNARLLVEDLYRSIRRLEAAMAAGRSGESVTGKSKNIGHR